MYLLSIYDNLSNIKGKGSFVDLVKELKRRKYNSMQTNKSSLIFNYKKNIEKKSTLLKFEIKQNIYSYINNIQESIFLENDLTPYEIVGKITKDINDISGSYGLITKKDMDQLLLYVSLIKSDKTLDNKIFKSYANKILKREIKENEHLSDIHNEILKKKNSPDKRKYIDYISQTNEYIHITEKSNLTLEGEKNDDIYLFILEESKNYSNIEIDQFINGLNGVLTNIKNFKNNNRISYKYNVSDKYIMLYNSPLFEKFMNSNIEEVHYIKKNMDLFFNESQKVTINTNHYESNRIVIPSEYKDLRNIDIKNYTENIVFVIDDVEYKIDNNITINNIKIDLPKNNHMKTKSTERLLNNRDNTKPMVNIYKTIKEFYNPIKNIENLKKIISSNSNIDLESISFMITNTLFEHLEWDKIQALSDLGIKEAKNIIDFKNCNTDKELNNMMKRTYHFKNPDFDRYIIKKNIELYKKGLNNYIKFIYRNDKYNKDIKNEFKEEISLLDITDYFLIKETDFSTISSEDINLLYKKSIKDRELIFILAKHPKTSIELLNKMLEECPYSISKSLLSNPNINTDLIKKLSNKNLTDYDIYKIAINNKTPIDVLLKIAKEVLLNKYELPKKSQQYIPFEEMEIDYVKSKEHENLIDVLMKKETKKKISLIPALINTLINSQNTFYSSNVNSSLIKLNEHIQELKKSYDTINVKNKYLLTKAERRIKNNLKDETEIIFPF